VTSDFNHNWGFVRKDCHVRLAWFLWSGEVREKFEDQGKSGNLKVPECKF